MNKSTGVSWGCWRRTLLVDSAVGVPNLARLGHRIEHGVVAFFAGSSLRFAAFHKSVALLYVSLDSKKNLKAEKLTLRASFLVKVLSQ